MMREPIVVIVRVPAALVRLGLAGGLLCLLASAMVSEDMFVGASHISPSGVYAGLTVSGQEMNGAESGMWVTSPTGARVGIRNAAPNATLSVTGSATIGANIAAPLINGVRPALHTAGAASGLLIASRAGAALWDFFPSGAGLGIRYSAGNPWSSGPPVVTFDSTTGMLLQACRAVPYSGFSGSSTSCPANHYVVSAARGGDPNNLQFRNRMPPAGFMICCRVMRR